MGNEKNASYFLKKATFRKDDKLVKGCYSFLSQGYILIDERMSDRLIKRSTMFFFFGNKQNKGNILIEEKVLLGLPSFSF